MIIGTASSAPLWIAGWILVLAVLVGAVIYVSRKRKQRHGQR